ncbi:hypothetical protein, variant [Aphanomyces invadans]|uniref:Uncharacterized protein n=1 Tax=Aphanomyces invadans TaxID=157072 RepID=A0A024TH70_9STRA|nr:hypothetical protein, variant [Aphanomyces invadans]ETV92906.1 hypothetical protein, variant [Aphanomyces invadans]|eukprot:XP_008878426.1 hypothetical protein, variant [Aphanomyces invadans]
MNKRHRHMPVSPQSVLDFSVRIDTPTHDVEVAPLDTPLPSTIWDALEDWAPGCSFAPAPSINHLLKRDFTATNMFAVDGMLFTYSAPSVTSYIVRPRLHEDETLSYRALSKQQMQQWAADKRSQAAALRQKGKCDEAITAYTAALEMDQEDVESFVGRGALYLELKRTDVARRDMESALKLQPSHSGALELQQNVHAAVAASMEVAPRQELLPSGKDSDRLRALLEMDIRQSSKDKKKDHKKEHKKKEKKKHKKRSRSRSSDRNARRKR